MTSSNRYQVESSNIIHETIDNEVVVVNLEKGYYYSLRDTAAVIWSRILAGMPVDAITQNISEKHGIERSQIEGSVNDFIRELVKEDIITAMISDTISEKNEVQDPELSEDINKSEFSIPVMEKFTDMADLLLLDPIHEVDESGWPNIAPEPPDEQP